MKKRRSFPLLITLGVTTKGITTVHQGLYTVAGVILCWCAGTGQFFCEVTAGNDERLRKNYGAYSWFCIPPAQTSQMLCYLSLLFLLLDSWINLLLTLWSQWHHRIWMAYNLLSSHWDREVHWAHWGTEAVGTHEGMQVIQTKPSRKRHLTCSNKKVWGCKLPSQVWWELVHTLLAEGRNCGTGWQSDGQRLPKTPPFWVFPHSSAGISCLVFPTFILCLRGFFLSQKRDLDIRTATDLIWVNDFIKPLKNALL